MTAGLSKFRSGTMVGWKARCAMPPMTAWGITYGRRDQLLGGVALSMGTVIIAYGDEDTKRHNRNGRHWIADQSARFHLIAGRDRHAAGTGQLTRVALLHDFRYWHFSDLRR